MTLEGTLLYPLKLIINNLKFKNMKPLKNLSLAFLSIGFFAACSSDDESPAPVNEEELITTLIVSLQPDGGGDLVLLSYRDIDGDGPNAPVITISGDLVTNTTYDGTIQLLNETETPAENITLEVLEEAEKHQFFYIVSNGFNVTTEYADTDADGNPIGVEFTLNAGEASSGSISFILRHEPNKSGEGVADGDITNAGGVTDIPALFNLNIL